MEASLGPGNPPHVPSGLWIGTRDWGTNSGMSAAGEKGVGVGVANGLGVAKGPSWDPAREHPTNADDKMIIKNIQESHFFFGFLDFLFIIHALNRNN